MRFLAAIFVSALLFSCVKRNSTNPVPHLEYKEATGFGVGKLGNDTVVVILSYEDGDGDLFVDDFSQGPNVIMTTSYFNSDSGKMVIDKSFPNTIRQPDNGYYKGKSIKGDIYLPLREFRSGSSKKIIKFDIVMFDLKKHQSNTISSPVYTLNF